MCASFLIVTVVDSILVMGVDGGNISWYILCGFLHEVMIVSSHCRHCGCQIKGHEVILQYATGEITPRLTLSKLQQQAMSLHQYHPCGSSRMP
jgi:hypothetical protein